MKRISAKLLCSTLIVSMAGCTMYARRQMSGKDTACVADLIDKGYVSGGKDSDSRRVALERGESFCYGFTEQERTQAKQLLDEGYFNAFGQPHRGYHFSEALDAVHEHSPKQIECAKKEYKDTPVAERRLLNFSEACQSIK
jgi:hypothetical protein